MDPRALVRSGVLMAVVSEQLATSMTAHAQQDAAREAFARGNQARRLGRLDEAASAFEESMRLSPSSAALVNLAGVYQRMGRYLHAVDLCESLLLQHNARPDVRTAARTTVDIARRGLAHYRLSVVPGEAQILVDGRSPRIVDGELLLDPVQHVVTVSMEGHETQRMEINLSPGAHRSDEVRLRELPAQLRIEANVPEAVLRVDGVESGRGATTLVLAAREYTIEATAAGYVPYRRSVILRRGVETRISANLVVPPLAAAPGLATRWWFWTGVGVVAGVVAGVIVWHETRSPCMLPESERDTCYQ